MQKAVLLGAFCALLLAGCSGKGEANVQSTGKVSSPESTVTEDAERTGEDRLRQRRGQKIVQGSETTFPERCRKRPGWRNTPTGSRSALNGLETKDYIFDFPAGWQGKQGLRIRMELPYVLVQQKASYEKMGDGLLFGIAAHIGMGVM